VFSKWQTAVAVSSTNFSLAAAYNKCENPVECRDAMGFMSVDFGGWKGIDYNSHFKTIPLILMIRIFKLFSSP
jgi:hypothetical protein